MTWYFAGSPSGGLLFSIKRPTLEWLSADKPEGGRTHTQSLHPQIPPPRTLDRNTFVLPVPRNGRVYGHMFSAHCSNTDLQVLGDFLFILVQNFLAGFENCAILHIRGSGRKSLPSSHGARQEESSVSLGAIQRSLLRTANIPQIGPIITLSRMLNAVVTLCSGGGS